MMPVAPLMILWAIDTLLLIKELFTIFGLSKVERGKLNVAHSKSFLLHCTLLVKIKQYN